MASGVVAGVSSLASEVVEKTRSVKSWKMDKVVVETGGAVTLGGATVFIR